MAICWPDVVTYLNTTLPSLWPAVTVFDGAANTGDDPTDYVTVGHTTDDTSGAFTQTQGIVDGPALDETGTVRMELVCRTGDDFVLDQVRARAFGYIATLDAHLRTDRSLSGALSKDGSTVGLTAEVLGIQANGTALALVVTVSYTSISWGF